MGYLCTLASVPAERVSEIRSPADLARVASKVNFASHFIAPLFAELTHAMDGGSPHQTDTWHPLRGFMVHAPSAVAEIASELTALGSSLPSPEHDLHMNDYIQEEFARVLQVFQHATAVGEAIVTCLDLNRPTRGRRGGSD